MLKRGILQGVFSWDVHPPKQSMSLGSSRIEGWVPLCDGRRILFPGTSACSAAVWAQTQGCLAQPLWRQIIQNPRAGCGKSVALCFFLHRIPRWVYLQGSGGGWIPCGRCRNVCRERLFAICCGLGTGSREVPSGTASSRRAPSAAAGSALLPDQNVNVFAPTSVHVPGLLCDPGASCPTVGTWFGGAPPKDVFGDILVSAHGSSSLTVSTALLSQETHRV